MNFNATVLSTSKPLFCLASALLLSSFTVPTESQSLQVTWAAERLEKVRTDSLSMPVHVWNCVCVEIAGHPINVILPHDLSGDTQRTRDLLLMLEGSFEEAFLGAGGQIGAWRDNGTLVGLEFRWSGGTNPVAVPAANDHLGTIGHVKNATGDLLADVYCFDATLMAGRVAALEQAMGGALVPQKVWLGPTLLSSGTGDQAMRISGTGTTGYGDVLTKGNFKVSGDDHEFRDQVRYGGSAGISGSGHDIPDHEEASTAWALPPFPSPVATYLLQAATNGTSFTGDVTIEEDGAGGLQTDTGIPVSGVIYSTGRIYLEGNGLTGVVTLVSELGVSISGNQSQLEPAVDDVLAIVVGGAVPADRLDNNVLIDGRMSSLEGSIWAPGGVVEIVATSSQLTGRVVAEKIRCTGYGNVLSDGCQ